MSFKLSTKDDLQCKYCGYVKERLDLYCYFAWDDGAWSDRRENAPKCAVPALVQYCPKCHRFYYIDAEGVRMTDVNDQNWIEPVEYEAIEPSVREYDDFDWDAAIEYNQRLRLMWAYNDKFYRGAVKVERSEFDIRVARWNLVHLTKFYDDHVMVAELLREAEMYDECLKVAADADVYGDEKILLERIVELAQKQDHKPFKISDCNPT